MGFLARVIVVMTSLLVMPSFVFSSTTFSVHIREESRIGMEVASAPQFLRIPASSSTYQLLSQQLIPNLFTTPRRRKWMAVEEETGKIILRNRVDREELCPDTVKCMIHMQIFSESDKKLLNLDVIIDDVNDNAPNFPDSKITVDISENAPIGDVISLDQYLAKDADIGANANMTYSVSANEYFQLVQEYDENEIRVQMKLIRSLDYERDSVQRLMLNVKDGGVPSLTNQIEITIRITDENDNDPVFEKKEYSVNLEENLSRGHMIARVVAHDTDSANAGRLRYFISPRNKEAAKRLVSVNIANGDVTLKEKLDRERHDRMKILIEARDSSLTNQRTGRTWLIINVEDINDNAPVISVSYILTAVEDTVYLPENSPSGTYFAYVTAKDADSGLNGEVNVRVQSISPAKFGLGTQPFSLENGFLGTTEAVDRETRDKYGIVISACDSGVSKQCSTKRINVILLDVNEHKPVFKTSSYFLNLPENTKVGTPLISVQATDGDATRSPALKETPNGEIVTSSNGDLTYSISGNEGMFSIDPRSGEITLVKPIDREHSQSHVISVIAQDGGRPMPLESKCEITITVDDVNDNTPIFINPTDENSTFYATILRDDIITRVQAVDYDEKANGEVSYKIISDALSGNTPSMFLINRNNGDLRINMSIDNLEENLGRHTIVVEASDNGQSPLSSKRSITIILTKLLTLPTFAPKINKVVAHSSSLFIIIAVLAVSLVFLLLLIVAVIWKCKRENKKVRTYSCRSSSRDNDEWCHASVTSMRNPRTTTSNNTSFENDSEVWSHVSSKRPDVLECSNHDVSNMARHNSIRSHLLRSSNRSLGRSLTARSATSDESKCYQVNKLAVPTMSCLHDGDSGRGDSDPDVASCDVTVCDTTYEPDLSKRSCNFHDNERDSLLGSRCTKQCLEYGHSDTCWMPSPDQDRPASTSTFAGSSTYVDLYPPVPHTQYDPRYNETPNNADPHLATIPESFTMRQYWPYPANDLSSIYSNVINYPPHFNKYHVMAHQSPTRQRDVISPASRMSPMSSLSSPASSRFHEDAARRNHYAQRHDVAPDDSDIRSVTSLSSPSSPKKIASPMTRSASADLLLKETSGHFQFPSPPKNNSSPAARKLFNGRNEYGEMSMRETKEIVDNIEKLLDS